MTSRYILILACIVVHTTDCSVSWALNKVSDWKGRGALWSGEWCESKEQHSRPSEQLPGTLQQDEGKKGETSEFFQLAIFLPLFKKLTIYFMLSCLYKEPATFNYVWYFVGDFFGFLLEGEQNWQANFEYGKNYINKSNQSSCDEFWVWQVKSLYFVTLRGYVSVTSPCYCCYF